MRNKNSCPLSHVPCPLIDGFLNLNKPAGMTSHDAVNHLRKIFSTRKVGHAGTLDPAACGVLPVAINRATKFLEYLVDRNKSYRAEILFGTATDSGDLDGKIISRAENFQMPTAGELDAALKNFVGEIEQVPPKFSAIKIHGRKAYELAKKNLDFEMPSRRVKIFRLELLGLNENSATIEIDCGKGTYVRSLAIDLGARLNLPATLKNLIRLKVGGFDLKNSLTFDEIKKFGSDCLLPIEKCLEHLPAFELDERRIRAFRNGLPTTIHAADEKFLRVTSGGKFLGVGKIERGELRASKIIA
ncbi:MAG: tRNA pseudouridine(55) synthase TruB [Selenomonadaceae bacterium]|nr:tRNA pseudouridine(55) synthase TruB [Selenomonadaceae bacterium]